MLIQVIQTQLLHLTLNTAWHVLQGICVLQVAVQQI